jgi:CRP-like cAMP-binding protein
VALEARPRVSPTESQPLDAVTRELDLRSGMMFVENERQLQQLLSIARAVEVRRGDRLFERGAPVSAVFLIMQGDVDLVAEAGPTWHFSGSGGIGFVDYMIGRPHARTAIARTHVRAVAIDAADYSEYMHDNVDLAHRAIARLGGMVIDDVVTTGDATVLARAPDDHAHPEGGEPTLIDRVVLLSRTPAFARAPVQALADLARSSGLARFSAGQVIAPAGTRSEVVSVLVRGQVELTAPGRGFTAIRGPIDLVGHAAELTDAPRLLAARAVRDSLVLQVHREDLLDGIDEHFELFQSLVAYVSRLREALNDAKAARGSDI